MNVWIGVVGLSVRVGDGGWWSVGCAKYARKAFALFDAVLAGRALAVSAEVGGGVFVARVACSHVFLAVRAQ